MAYTLTYTFSNNVYYVTGYTGTPVNVEIPTTYNDGLNGTHDVVRIGLRAFKNCTTLTSILIPNSITWISDEAFNGCTDLRSITIPNSVTNIGGTAFNGCTNLVSVIIGNSVTLIGLSAFSDCSSLTSITLLSVTPPTIYDTTFFNISSNAKFYCFQSTIEDYKTAINWDSFENDFIADDIRLYFIMNSISAKNYFAKKSDLADKANKATYETKSIQTTDWSALSNSTPYTYSAMVTATATISANTVVELLNDNPVLFATYGFAIAGISGQSVTIYAIDLPDSAVSLKIAIGG